MAPCRFSGSNSLCVKEKYPAGYMSEKFMTIINTKLRGNSGYLNSSNEVVNVNILSIKINKQLNGQFFCT